jgi:hypothetical protein
VDIRDLLGLGRHRGDAGAEERPAHGCVIALAESPGSSPGIGLVVGVPARSGVSSRRWFGPVVPVVIPAI